MEISKLVRRLNDNEEEGNPHTPFEFSKKLKRLITTYLIT